jgi:ATP-dependent Clp protease adapter protein ClpS
MRAHSYAENWSDGAVTDDMNWDEFVQEVMKKNFQHKLIMGL